MRPLYDIDISLECKTLDSLINGQKISFEKKSAVFDYSQVVKIAKAIVGQYKCPISAIIRHANCFASYFQDF